MGKIILCKGKVASEPYVFEATQTKVYSIEEVCYYIKHNIYLIKENYFSLEFASWLGKELDLKNLALKLRELIEKKADIRDIVVTVCCGCDYYTKDEIEKLITVMDTTENMDVYGRLKVRADNYFSCNELKDAARDYESMLKYKNSDDEDQKLVYKRLGIINMKLGNFRKAGEYYEKVYLMNSDFDALCGYLISLKLLGEFEEKIEKNNDLNIPPGDLRRFYEVYDQIGIVAKDSRLIAMVSGIENSYKSGKQAEFDDRIKEVMKKIKDDYRVLCN